MTALHWLTLAEAARALRRRELSAREYTEALLARIEAVNPKLDAFVALLAERARERAAALDSGPVRGALHGVPFGLKDIIDVAGVATTAHSAVLKGNVAAKDAGVTRRLEGAAGVLLGKLSTHEFAIGGPSFDLPWPPARNPWNTDCHPGGSSSGSGAGVAAGLFPLALGTDTGGSVRNPASCCGIVGMKATYGRVSRAGVVPLSWSMDHIGPMTRTVEDNALALEVLAGFDPEDPASADEPVPSYTAGLEGGVRGMKIGIVRRWHEEDMPAAPEMRAAIDEALRVLEGEGAEIVEVDPGPLQDYSRVNRIILWAEAWSIHEQWLKEKPEAYGRLGRERLIAGAYLSAGDYLRALRQRSRCTRRMSEALAGVDVLICASSMEPACAIEDEPEVLRTYSRQARQPFNVTGHPALAVPAGFSPAGMPLSFQIAGRNFDEATIYRAARAYERATGWPDRHPDL